MYFFVKASECNYENKIAYRYIRSKLKDDGKVQQKDVQEAFFNFILQLSSANLASIHMQLIRNVYRESDIELKEYLEVCVCGGGGGGGRLRAGLRFV